MRRSYIDGPIRGRPAGLRPVRPAAPPDDSRPAAPELPANDERPPKQARRFSQTRLLMGVIVLLIILIADGGIYLIKNRSNNPSRGQQNSSLPSGYFPASLSNADINIAVYYPVNLPGGYSVGGFSVIQKNILYYIVTDNKAEKYYVTIQPLPSSFDFVSFAKKFTQPDQYNTPLGSVTVGVSGANLIGSIQTNQNSWILLNSANSSSKPNMETITRALEQVKL